MIRHLSLVVLVSFSLAAACTERNPAYMDTGTAPPTDLGLKDGKVVPPDGSGVKKDQGMVKKDQGMVKKDKGMVKKDKGVAVNDKTVPPDTKPWTDSKPWPDLVPPPDQYIPPDTVAWQCNKNIDCDDKTICTIDVCTPQKKCSNTLVAGVCLIGGSCYKTGDVDKTNSCQLCAPSASVSSWTPKANGLGCAGDGLGCTVDSCQNGKCTHLVNTTSCLIGGTCYGNNKANPQNSCATCDVSKSQSGWSNAKDGTACPGDTLSCTKDQCKAGVCDHPLASGCIIGGKCVGQGVDDPADPCKECDANITTKGYTFITGKDCTSGNTPGFCAASTCLNFTHSNVTGSNTSSDSRLVSVAHVPASKSFWAAGYFRQSNSNWDGLLVDVTTAGTSGVTKITTGSRFRSVHHNLAVGDSGNFYEYDATSGWKSAAALKTSMGNHTRFSVWGATFGNKVVYYLAGQQAGTNGIVRCDGANMISGQVTCTKHSGVPNQAWVYGITGSLKGTAQGPLWAFRGDSPSADDIFYNSGSGTSWTRSNPHGCQDAGSNPCAGSATDWYSIYALSSTEVWVVGYGGWMMRYNGTKWTKVSNAFTGQNNHSITAVYGDSTEKLVTIAAGVNTGGGGHEVRLYNYNITRNEWFGPIGIQSGSSSSYITTNQIYDIDGDGYQELWMVGNRRSGSGYNAKTIGWVVKAQ